MALLWMALMGCFTLYGIQSSALKAPSLITYLNAPHVHGGTSGHLAYIPIRFNEIMGDFEAATAAGWLPLRDQSGQLHRSASLSIAGQFDGDGRLHVKRVMVHPHRRYKVYIGQFSVVLLMIYSLYTLLHARQKTGQVGHQPANPPAP